MKILLEKTFMQEIQNEVIIGPKFMFFYLNTNHTIKVFWLENSKNEVILSNYCVRFLVKRKSHGPWENSITPTNPPRPENEK